MTRRLQTLFFLSIISILVILMLFTYSRGTLLYDEGWILHPAERLLQGDIPYKDFHFIYTPGSLYVTALGFMIFGESVFSTRIIVFLFSILTILAILHLSKKIKFGLFATLIALTTFVVWTPLHLNFSWPVIYAIFTGIATCVFLIEAEAKKSIYFFTLAGVSTVLAIFFKQNFGLATLISGLLFFLISKEKQRLKNALDYLLGFLGFTFGWFIYLILSNSLVPFLKDFYFFMVQQIIINSHQATPFIYPAPFVTEILKTIFYLSPLILSFFAFFVLRKGNERFYILPIFVSLFYLLGIRPTTDYVHIIPLISLSGIPAGIILTISKNNYLKFSVLFYSLILIAVGFYSAFFTGYYKWNPIILDYKYTVQNPKLNVLVDKNTSQVIPTFEKYLNNNSKKNDYILVYQFSPLLYFIYDRKNPTKFEFMPANILSEADNKEIINNLEEKHVKLIIVDHSLVAENSPIGNYIKKNYTEGITTDQDNFVVWKKK